MNKNDPYELFDDDERREFINGMVAVANKVNSTANRKQFWEGEANVAEKIALIHSEASETLEALRRPVPEHSKKIPDFMEVEDELADIVIRVMDFAVQFGFRLPEAILAKAQYNDSRPPKHGKLF